MFGPPGCLTEASVNQAGSAVPESWGLFPRSVLTLMSMPDVQSMHASAVEVYHENVFDLLDDRAQLAVGSSKPMGNKVLGKAAEGHNNPLAINGVHPACCTCMGCFKLQEEAKKEAVKRRQQLAAGAGAAKAAGPRRSTPGGRGQDDGSFATVGETLVPLKDAVDVARFARTVEATRTANSHLLNHRSSRSHCLVKVHITRGAANAQGGSAGAGACGKRVTSILFVDLAGSERIYRTGAEGAAKVEAQSINR
eukprot:Tamp_06087.p1 GENE.Tamp_06087~~Tamp_06087.p1  ORF type:complete len:252 (-),score=53.42 Tamp_06087:1570-2325(-)